MRFHKTKAWISFGLLVIEIFIALFFTRGFIRSFMGDVLSVCLLYALVGTFFDFNRLKLGLSVLIFAFAVEFAQYFKLTEYLGLAKDSFSYIVLGATFDLLDLLAYGLGIIVCLIFDYKLKL